ncbi:restriction endonuclease subunit S [candidate division KSB1 bacterium]|nr:restriction endonuclease subunit S [candidate division KSB1 bacterium]
MKMNKNWTTIKLGDVLYLDIDRVELNPAETYEMVGVYSFGRGLFHREPVNGQNTSYKYFYRLKPDHIVMSQLFGWEGALALSSDQFAGKFVSPQFPTFKTREDRLDRNYLGWFIKQPVFWQELGKRTKGMGDRRRTLNPDALFDCKLPIPILEEQKRISDKITKIAVKIEKAKLSKLQAKSKFISLKKSLINNLIKNNITRKHLKEIISQDSSLSYGVLVPGPHIDNGIPFVRVQDLDISNPSDMPVKRISPHVENKYQKTRLKGDEVLIAVVGSIGKIGIVPKSWKGANIARAVCRIEPGPEVDKSFLATILQSDECQKYFRDSTRTLAQPTLNIGQLAEVQIPVPSIDEQITIMQKYNKMRQRIEALEKMQNKTEIEINALLSTILDKAFKGEL